MPSFTAQKVKKMHPDLNSIVNVINVKIFLMR